MPRAASIMLAVSFPCACALTAAAAIEATYPGWYVRLLDVPDCPTHRVAFVGAPGGDESRWLEVKKSEAGWILVADERVSSDGWPAPPEVGWCD